MTTRLIAVSVALLLGSTVAPSAQQTRAADEVTTRLGRLEQWLAAIAAHRPGALDDSVLLINAWNEQQLRLIWIDVSSIVSLVREPDVLLSGAEPQSRSTRPARRMSPGNASLLYTDGELHRLRALARQVSPTGESGPENDILKRGAMLHADIELVVPINNRGSASGTRSGDGGLTVFMNDGRQTGSQNVINHWDMGRRLLAQVHAPKGLKTTPDPDADETVRRWYLVGCAYMAGTAFIEPMHFTRALELFPDDPEILFFAASAHETFAGVRMQSAMRSIKAPRDVRFDVQDGSAELRQAEQLYKLALERNPHFIEARVRLGRVLGLRGRHQEAVEQLRFGVSATEPLLQYYAHLFLGREYETLGNGPDARRSYERAAALVPTAQSPLLGLSRVADEAGDRAAARDAIARLVNLRVTDQKRADPWWVYEIVPARGVDGLLADLRQRIAALPK
jgi:tetratricopeptide (TPR) repeat protein